MVNLDFKNYHNLSPRPFIGGCVIYFKKNNNVFIVTHSLENGFETKEHFESEYSASKLWEKFF
jgi:hypothetical protein